MSEQAQAQPKRPPTDAASVIGTELPKWWDDPNTEDFRNTATTFAELLNPLPTSPEEAALMAGIPLAGGLISRVGLRAAKPILRAFDDSKTWQRILDAVHSTTRASNRKALEQGLIITPAKEGARISRSKDVEAALESVLMPTPEDLLRRDALRQGPVINMHTHLAPVEREVYGARDALEKALPIPSRQDYYAYKFLHGIPRESDDLAGTMMGLASQSEWNPILRNKGFMVTTPETLGAARASPYYSYATILDPTESSKIFGPNVATSFNPYLDRDEMFARILHAAKKGRAQVQYDLPEDYIRSFSDATLKWSK